ncbi:uncharacterized protein LOC132687082 [Panthera onca]|uniref:uncharacterized protein LOC132687082 n=1 Tax=Panthera onca TaxID=9690 RepID=UPI002954F11E|nr:uncharacterized protein LOC132687082 [Panthera onca]
MRFLRLRRLPSTESFHRSLGCQGRASERNSPNFRGVSPPRSSPPQRRARAPLGRGRRRPPGPGRLSEAAAPGPARTGLRDVGAWGPARSYFPDPRRRRRRRRRRSGLGGAGGRGLRWEAPRLGLGPGPAPRRSERRFLGTDLQALVTGKDGCLQDLDHVIILLASLPPSGSLLPGSGHPSHASIPALPETVFKGLGLLRSVRIKICPGEGTTSSIQRTLWPRTHELEMEEILAARPSEPDRGDVTICSWQNFTFVIFSAARSPLLILILRMEGVRQKRSGDSPGETAKDRAALGFGAAALDSRCQCSFGGHFHREPWEMSGTEKMLT